MVARALAALRWEWKGNERAEALEEALHVEELPKLGRRVPRPKGRPSLIDVTVDEGFMRVKERATAELLPTRPELAPVVVGAMRHASGATADRLYAALSDNGHGELALAAFKEMHASITDGRLLRTSKGRLRRSRTRCRRSLISRRRASSRPVSRAASESSARSSTRSPLIMLGAGQETRGWPRCARTGIG